MKRGVKEIRRIFKTAKKGTEFMAIKKEKRQNYFDCNKEILKEKKDRKGIKKSDSFSCK
ncbi:hypothetical protein [Flavobacterium bizetiae]|uniref:hypothetical protein n=1 Tax=Flavobacterium bizetiae TaxID=2704140 RepID=UPI00190D9F28|nr:hypothetical protein [Flavobacterium bizetiae]